MIANEEKGRREPETDAHLFDDSISFVPGLTTVSAKKDHVVFCCPPPSHRGFDVVLKGPPSPSLLNEPPSADHVVCVPSFKRNLKHTLHSTLQLFSF